MSSINSTSILGTITNALTISVSLPIQNHLDITANFAIPFSNSARFVGYDNTEVNELQAVNVQDAIDELAQRSGKSLIYYVKASGTIRKGKVVQFKESQGDHLVAKEAVRTEVNNFPGLVMGIAETQINNGEFGNIIAFGEIDNYDTGTFNTNDILWYDSVGLDPGGLTTTEPNAPNAKILVAAVLKKETSGPANNGKILVRITFEPRLEDLQDILITSPQNNQILKYENGVWVNGEPIVPYYVAEPEDPENGVIWYEEV